MGEATPQVRVGDRERRVVDDRLLAAVGDGVLTLHEYDERSALLWRARTRAELDALQADLPVAPAAAEASPAVPDGGARPHRVVAVLSEDRFAGAVVPGQEVQGYAVLGRAVVDLRSAALPDGTRVRVRSVLGDVEVQVPAGASVQLSGLTVLGDRRVAVTSGAGPTVHLDAVAVLGSVSVTHGDGTPPRPALPAQRPTAVEPASSHRVDSPTGLRGLLRHAKGVLVAGALLGGLALAGPDSIAVFGNSVERVTTDRDVEVSTLFGNVTVVVPDGSRVDQSGFVVFGNSACDACSEPGSGAQIDVRALGAFGNVEVLTASQYEARQRSEAEQERIEERQERLEEERELREDAEDDDG